MVAGGGGHAGFAREEFLNLAALELANWRDGRGRAPGPPHSHAAIHLVAYIATREKGINRMSSAIDVLSRTVIAHSASQSSQQRSPWTSRDVGANLPTRLVRTTGAGSVSGPSRRRASSASKL